MIRNEDLIVNYLDMPTTVRGRTVPNPDGTFSIFINSKLSIKGQKKALAHEVRHIMRGDFDYDKETDVQLVELEAHGISVEAVRHAVLIKRKKSFKRKWARLQRQRKFFESIGYDFMADAESRYLDPEC